MLDHGAIKLYVVWDQGSDEIICPVEVDTEFSNCIILMEQRLWKDRI